MGERISETRELWREHGLVGEHFGKSTFIGENTFLASTLGRTLFWRVHFFLNGEQHFFFDGRATDATLASSIQFSANLFFGFFSFFYLFLAGSF